MQLPKICPLLFACAVLAMSAQGCKHANSAKSAKSDSNAMVANGSKSTAGADKVALAPAKLPPKPAPDKPKPLPKRIDTKDLDSSEMAVLVQIIDDQFDPCGKPRSFRQSLDAGDCALATRLARFVVHKLQQGYGKRKIVKLLLREIERINTIVELNTKGAPLLGPADSKVKVVIFSDFECPFCRRTAVPLKKLQAHYKFALYYKHYPLKASHPHAEGAAMAAWAAHHQGKFWQMHDLLFENAPELKWAQVQGYAKEIGLDLKRFKKDALSKQAKAAVAKDYAQGGDADVDGTPTFFVNGRRAETMRQLQGTVREQLSLTGSKTLPDAIEVGDYDDPTEAESPAKETASNAAKPTARPEDAAPIAPKAAGGK